MGWLCFYHMVQDKYFSNYNLYIKEMVFYVQKNGKKPNSACAKFDFEKNHTQNK